ncbi:MAG TPA: M91 family zinc metallopeptidase [Actinoplanes sp.]|nr:M91 family zinc metallopeptidase [Actinoplanes sp.]
MTAPQQAPATISVGDVWSLHARPDQVSAAATAWRGVATALGDTADEVSSAAQSLLGDGWAGDAADSYATHRGRLVADLDDAQAQATAAADALEDVAGALRTAQSHLTGEWGQVVSVPFTYDAPMHLLFAPATDAQSKTVVDSYHQCTEIRSDLDGKIGGSVRRFRSAQTEFARIAAAWAAVANGGTPFDMPPEAAKTRVIQDGDRVIVNTGTGDDQVRISIDPATGQQIVEVNGQRYLYPADADIVVRGGEGNDTITVAPGTGVHVTLLGGAGEDVLTGGDGADTVYGLDGKDLIKSGGGDDRVSAGAGRDYADAGAGNDIVSGGMGDDILYGLGGDDALDGGEGQDYLEGATGDDTIDGGTGDDIISGGRDDDTLRAGGGNDKIYAGAGSDRTDGGRGSDTVFGERNDSGSGTEKVVTVEIKTLQTFIQIEGSPEFRERIEADLEMLGSSPTGQQMLGAMQKGHEDTEGGWWLWHHDGDSLTIKEYDNPADPNNSTASTDGHHNVIAYNTHIEGLNTSAGRVEGPPSTVLYHEFAHVYDYMNDTLAEGDHDGPENAGVPNKERAAAGLPIDHDGDPNTPDRIDPDHPYPLTENGLREEMGAPHRDAY